MYQNIYVPYSTYSIISTYFCPYTDVELEIECYLDTYFCGHHHDHTKYKERE